MAIFSMFTAICRRK